MRTATSTSFWTISRALLSFTAPHTHRVPCSTSCLSWSGADWCLDSDVVTDVGLQVALIAALEAAAEAPNFGEDDTKETANMKFRALNNVQLVIKRVHIRYESRGTGGGVGVGAGADAAPRPCMTHPFSCGLMLSELSARSASEAWSAVPMGDDPKVCGGGVTWGAWSPISDGAPFVLLLCCCCADG